MKRTRRIVWGVLAFCSIAACDSIIGPGVVSGSIARVRYPLVTNALRRGMTRGELYDRLAALGEPIDLSGTEDGSLALTFERWHTPCSSDADELDVRFDTTWDARLPQEPARNPRIPEHSLDRVIDWQSHEVSSAC